MAAAVLFVACNNDDSVINNITGTGNLGVEFDNSFAGNDLVLGAANSQTSSNEVLKIDHVKYIISSIAITDQNGTVYRYPKAKGCFIVNEADENTHLIELENIPAGNYTSIKFGIGVDRTQYGSEADQPEFYAQAHQEGMIDDWASGYKFLMMDGSFSGTGMADNPFAIQTKKVAANENYKEVTLPLPTPAMVRTTIAPEIHIVANLAQLFQAVHLIKLADNPTITDGADVTKVTENWSGVFSVAHVHND